MTIDNTTSLLFPTFPRKVGNPARGECKSKWEFENFIISNNGIRDCFVCLYDYKHVDKIWFDFDYKSDPSVALKETQQLVKWCMDNNLFVIPVATGKKGYHVYIFTTRIKIIPEDENRESPTKTLLRNVGLSIIDKVFGHNEKNILKAVSVDYPWIGDFRRLTRIPNTLRPPKNNTYCTYLPLSFIAWEQLDVEKYMKDTHYLTYDTNKDVIDLEHYELQPYEVLAPHKEAKSKQYSSSSSSIETPLNANKYLKEMLRPCIYYEIIGPDPPHEIRLAAAAELLQFFNPDEVVGWFRQLGWVDWIEKTANHQVRSCVGLKPFSCRRLKRYAQGEMCPC